jgi:hypothetical protein
VRRQFIEKLLGQIDRKTFKILSGLFSFSHHQALGVFQIGQIPTTPLRSDGNVRFRAGPLWLW